MKFATERCEGDVASFASVPELLGEPLVKSARDVLLSYLSIIPYGSTLILARSWEMEKKEVRRKHSLILQVLSRRTSALLKHGLHLDF